MDDGGDDELRDAVARLDDVGLASPRFDEQHLHLAAVVAVDGPGRVGQRDAELARQARARPDLALEARRDLEGQPGGNRRRRAPGAIVIGLVGRARRDPAPPRPADM